MKLFFWSHSTLLGPLGYLTWPHIMEFFQKSMVLVLLGLEVITIPFSAMVDFMSNNRDSSLMWQLYSFSIYTRDGFTPGHSTPQSNPVQGVEWICYTPLL